MFQRHPLENQNGKSKTRDSSIVMQICSHKLFCTKFIVIRRAKEAAALAFAGRLIMKIVPVPGNIFESHVANAYKPVENTGT